MNIFIKKLSLFHYNIGFFPFEADSLLAGKAGVKWLKHTYRDRFFADPFILSADEKEIRVLVEDFIYSRWKGDISLLVVDRNTMKLKRKKTLLSLDTHLSFPFIYREGQQIYIVPENSASGCLTAYRYLPYEEKLEKAGVLTEMPVIDPVVRKMGDGRYMLIGSLKSREENERVYQWMSTDLLKGYQLVKESPIKQGKENSRRAGDFFTANGRLYAATQCCAHSYGEATHICRVDKMDSGQLQEIKVSVITPKKEYPYGLHTLNIRDGWCVVDGLTFLFRPWEKLKIMMRERRG